MTEYEPAPPLIPLGSVESCVVCGRDVIRPSGWLYSDGIACQPCGRKRDASGHWSGASGIWSPSTCDNPRCELCHVLALPATGDD